MGKFSIDPRLSGQFLFTSRFFEIFFDKSNLFFNFIFSIQITLRGCDTRPCSETEFCATVRYYAVYTCIKLGESGLFCATVRHYAVYTCIKLGESGLFCATVRHYAVYTCIKLGESRLFCATVRYYAVYTCIKLGESGLY